MSWLRDDDDMLDHEKWRRAIRDGGDGALLVWARLRAWCSRRLTDGVIPADMVDEVAEIGRSKSRSRALHALVAHALCAWREDGALTICGYLERNPSKARVLEERERRSEAQRKRRVGPNVTGHATSSEPSCNEVPAQSRPGPIPAPEEEREPARASEVRPVPGLEIVAEPSAPLPAVPHGGPLKPSQWDQAPPVLQPLHRVMRFEYDPGWSPTKANQARGHELGLTDEEIWARWESVREKPYPRGFWDDQKQFNRELAWAAQDKTTKTFKTRAERDAFEMPGKERRA